MTFRVLLGDRGSAGMNVVLALDASINNNVHDRRKDSTWRCSNHSDNFCSNLTRPLL